VPTRRKRPVLYEIVRHTRRSSDVGWRDRRTLSEAQKSRAAEPLRADPAPGAWSPPADPARSPANPAGANVNDAAHPGGWPDSADSTGAARSVRFVEGRLLVDLAWPGITATTALAIFLLALAFQIGKRYAEPVRPAADTQHSLTGQAGDPAALLPPEIRPGGPSRPLHRTADNVQVAPTAAARSEEPAPETTAEPPPQQADEPAFEFQTGYHYVVAQYFPLSHEQPAYDAAAFLRANGVDATVVKKKVDIELVATQPFLLRQKDRAARDAAHKACNALKNRIRELGLQFAKQQTAARKPVYALDQPAERLWTR
jgi:hypothetical protein